MLQRSLVLMCLCSIPLRRFPWLSPSLVVPVQLQGFPGSSKLDNLLIYTNITPTGQGVKDLGTHVIIVSLLYHLGRNR